MAAILTGTDMQVNSDVTFTKVKIQANGRKSVGILNSSNNKGLYISSPLMLTWGVNVYEDEKTGAKTYDLALQFPKEEYETPQTTAFLENMKQFESKVKENAVKNCKEWLGKTKATSDVIDALWSPMLKYPKNEHGEPDETRAPTLKVKIPCWEGEFKNVEIYDENQKQLFPNDNEESNIQDYIVKGSNVATIIQCGGIWVANGKFGVTWRLFQAVAKPRSTLSGKCHISLTSEDKEKMKTRVGDNNESENEEESVKAAVEDSDDDDDETIQQVPIEVVEEVKQEVAKSVVTEDTPKKKRVVKKKSTE
jgi:hypothetical protein